MTSQEEQISVFTHAACSETELLDQMQTSLKTGLSYEEAGERLKREGFNEIRANSVKWWQIAIRQFNSPFIYLLIIAACIVFAIGEEIDAVIIIGFVCINTALGFFQEHKSEQALRALQEYISPRSKIKRNSTWDTWESKYLVRGDIISLATGDAVPADVRILESQNLVVNETSLTGESVPVPKIASTLPSIPTTIYDSQNLCFNGTSVIGGEAVGVVVGTGSGTTMGRIAKLTVETTKESEFSKGISQFSKFILRMIVITLIVIFIVNLIIKGESADIPELVVFCIALVVSVVPEALPVVTTVSLSQGALQLAKQQVIVKRLTAIEDIGSIEVLCSDKTGTLTENSLTITGYSPESDPDLLYYASLTTATVREKTEPFDIAIEKEFTGVSRDEKLPRRVAEIPFDPVRKRNAVLIEDDEHYTLIVRGAPETIISLSSSLSDNQKNELLTWIRKKGLLGERTIALARRLLDEKPVSISPSLEANLQFLGIITFTDPIKPSTFRAVEKAKELGVYLKIITGDSPEVAGAVGKAIGLLDDPTQVVTGSVLQEMSTDDRTTAVEGHAVIARVTPEQKYEIIQILQKKYTVGFLGEGINDAPALKLAGVSMVVQSAADIAREAADIILLQQNLEVIIDGIRGGRAVFANSIKYLKATLASNFGHFYAIAIGSMFISFLPMLPVQILLVNLLSDFPMISIATDRVDSFELTKPRRYEIKDIVLIATLMGVVVAVFDLIFFAFFMHKGDQILQTNWFVGSILTELVFLFSIRTKLPFYKASRPSLVVLLLTIIALIATVLLPYTAIGQEFFHFTPPSGLDMGIILIVVCVFFTCSELVKHLYYQYTST